MSNQLTRDEQVFSTLLSVSIGETDPPTAYDRIVSLLASGIETRRAETTKIGSVEDESPTRQGDAHTQSSSGESGHDPLD